MHLSRFRALDFKGFLKLHISPPERLRTPSRGPPVQALPHPSGSSPLPHPKPTIFPVDPCPGLCRHQNGGRGWGKDLGSQGFPLVPHPLPPPPSPTPAPAPTWAYPCRLVFLPILAAGAPPGHLDPQTCRGLGWGSRGRCSRALGALPSPPAPPRRSPAAPSLGHPQAPADHHFRPQQGPRGAGGAGDRGASVSEGSSPWAVQPSPGKGPPFSAATRGAAAGRGGFGLCAASPRGTGPTPRRPPPALHTNPREPLRVPYLVPLRLRLLLLGPPAASTPSGPPGADTQKGASDGRV